MFWTWRQIGKWVSSTRQNDPKYQFREVNSKSFSHCLIVWRCFPVTHNRVIFFCFCLCPSLCPSVRLLIQNIASLVYLPPHPLPQSLAYLSSSSISTNALKTPHGAQPHSTHSPSIPISSRTNGVSESTLQVDLANAPVMADHNRLHTKRLLYLSFFFSLYLIHFPTFLRLSFSSVFVFQHQSSSIGYTCLIGNCPGWANLETQILH